MSVPKVILAVIVITLSAFAAGCPSGGGTGACVSSRVDYSSFSAVYCYDGWDKSDCTSNNEQHVNGASWTFYSGDSCSDRGYHSGSN